MINSLLGTKQNMAVRFTKQGARVVVTNVMVEPNVVLKIAEGNTVIGLGQKKRIKKTDGFYVKSAGFMPRFIKEIKSDKADNIKSGDKLTVSVFEPGDEVKVTGTTKGKGFAGGVKRWGFHGGPKTHGQSDRHRAPGSSGAGTTPGRVFKGKKMAGHMGNSKITVTGLEVIDVDQGNNMLIVKGSVPGAKNGLLIIEKTGKVKGYTPPPPPSEEKAAEKEERAEEEAKAAKVEASENKSQEVTQESQPTKPQPDSKGGENAK